MTTRPIFLLIATFVATAVCAEEYVDRADVNGDGFVSLYELRAAHYADPDFNKRIEQQFAAYDRNGDGLISDDERRAQDGGAQKAAANRAAAVRSEEASAGDLSRGGGPATSTGAAPPADAQPAMTTGSNEIETLEPIAIRRSAMSRNEAWIREIDADRSGGASQDELLASGDGQRWFSKREFKTADRNGDGDLDAAELAGLISSIELRQRYARPTPSP